MSAPVDTHCLPVLENGEAVSIGFVEEHECEHCGTWYKAWAFSGVPSRGEYELGTYETLTDAADAVHEEYEHHGPFSGDEEEQ